MGITHILSASLIWLRHISSAITICHSISYNLGENILVVTFVFRTGWLLSCVAEEWSSICSVHNFDQAWTCFICMFQHFSFSYFILSFLYLTCSGSKCLFYIYYLILVNEIWVLELFMQFIYFRSHLLSSNIAASRNICTVKQPI